MLSVDKLNKNRARVSQQLTERGILKDKHKEIVEAVALTLAPKEYTGEEKTIDEQLATMKREKNEKKLLEYQLRNNPQNVSTFLANKYADGNFNIAQKDRYDNSEERKTSGLTFDYHVYLPMDPRYNDKRGHNKYILSDTILDRTSGDSYTYHIPMWINSDSAVPFFVTDYGEVVDDANSKGLRWALTQLRVAIDSGRFQLDPLSEEILTQFGFLVDGKIVHDIKGDVLVEKYLKSISPPEKKAAAIRYLDTSLKSEEVLENDPVGLEDVAVKFNASEAKPGSIDSLEQLRAELGEDLDATYDNDSFLETSSESEPAGVKTVAIKPGDYAWKKVSDVAKDNGIPVIEYKQTSKGNTPAVITWLEVFTGDTVYRLGFRTGFVGSPIGGYTNLITNYHKDVLSKTKEGKLVVSPLGEYLEILLKKKGFDALLKGEKPKLVVDKFDRAKTL